MNTFWLKIAGLAVIVLGLVFLVNVFLSKTEPGSEPEQKTIYDQWEQDDERLRAKPQLKEQPTPEPSVEPENVKQAIEPAKTVEPTRTVEPAKPQFKELSLEDRVQAEKLFNLAIQERKMGRLPVIKLGYRKMAGHCREIIRRWPDSVYAFKAKRMLADIPERYRKMYNITNEEIDLGNLK